MTTELKGKTALITGAARRIGRAIALSLAGEGVNVVLHYNESAAEAESLVGELESSGVSARAVSSNFKNPENASTLFRSAMELSGAVDILVNSASIFPESSMADSGFDDFMENFKVNAFAPFAICREVAAQNRSAQIVNMLDSRITDYDKQHVPYHLSKRALFEFTRMMSVEFAPMVRVNAVAPGVILPPPGRDEQYLAAMAQTNPLQKTGTLENVTDAVLFLLKNDFVTGQVLFVDGGRHLKGSMYGL